MILVIFLGIIAIVDMATQRIPLIILGFMAAVGGYIVCRDEKELQLLLFAIIPGIVLLLIAFLTKQQIGYGDAVVIMLMGLFVNVDVICSALIMALMIAGIFAVIMVAMKKADRKKQIAFTPFLLLGYGLMGVMQ